MIILGIETSCDETAAALVEDGYRTLSSVVSSQVAAHRPYGGVVLELASRKHIEAIVPVFNEALETAGLRMDQVDAVAVTRARTDRLASVGFSFAKALAWSRKIPWVGVNHLLGHIHAVFLGSNPPPFPCRAGLRRAYQHLLGDISHRGLGDGADPR